MIYFKIFPFLCVYFIRFDFVNSDGRCSDNTVGFYPKCECELDNYGYSEKHIYVRDCIPLCPSISDGDFPKCKCRYGDAYDNVTNSCPIPKCPGNTTLDSVYPRCKCTGKNYEYNEYLNGCYLVCPENSDGYFPNCKCEDETKRFNKDLFQCLQCPVESTADSIYPNCRSESIKNATFDRHFNEFRICHHGSYGKWPNCTCENGNVYYSDDSYAGHFYGWRKSGCFNCPWNLKGKYPNCECSEGEIFDLRGCKSITCAWNDIGGTYPDCTCPGDSVYDASNNACRECPSESTGKYPNCICKHPMVYRQDWDRCVSCPDDSTGIYPNCTCSSEKGGFEFKYATCYDCPVNSIGRHPNCKCENEGEVYDSSLRFCGAACEDGFRAHPLCTCESFYKFFLEKETRKCRPFTYEGRSCPPNAIGKSPNCHCVQDKYFFVPYGWGCFKEYEVGGKTFSCEDDRCKHFMNFTKDEVRGFWNLYS